MRVLFVVFAVAVVLDNVIDILVATSAAADENGACAHLFCLFHGEGDCVRGFQRGNDAFVAGEFEEGIDGLFVIGGHILNAADVFPESVFRSDGRIVESARDGVDRIGISVLILQHIAVESVQSSCYVKFKGLNPRFHVFFVFSRFLNSFLSFEDKNPPSAISCSPFYVKLFLLYFSIKKSDTVIGGGLIIIRSPTRMGPQLVGVGLLCV